MPFTPLCPPVDLAEVLSRPAAQRAIAAKDVTHFAILCAHDGLGYFAERRLEDSCSRQQTIADIASGQVERVMKVFAFNPIEGWSSDVTADLAIELANSLDAGEPISSELRDFIETNAGIEWARGLSVADRSFAAA